jgi:guanylate kinase
MRSARAEISHAEEFDHRIVNDNFDAALADLHSIIRNGRARRAGPHDRSREILAELLETE